MCLLAPPEALFSLEGEADAVGRQRLLAGELELALARPAAGARGQLLRLSPVKDVQWRLESFFYV